MLMLGCAIAAAQEKGNWRAANQTAKSITGDVQISNEKIAINFATFTIAEIRSLTAAEMGAVSGDEASGSGNLYRLSVPATQKFLKKNTLCGSDETQWMATFVAGKSLRIVLFSGASMPVFTAEALTNSPNLCGTFDYVR